MQPLYIYIDFDGCVSAFSDGAPKTNTGFTGEWSEEKIDGQRVFWSHELVDALNELDEREDVVFIWASDWQKGIVEASERLGLAGTRWEYLRASEDDIRTDWPWWKVAAIESDMVERGVERAVWIDDNIRFSVAASKVKATLFCPIGYHGITKRHIREITQLADMG